MKISENVSLRDLTTMRVGGATRFLVEIFSEEDVVEAYRFAEERGLPVFVLGRGANTLVKDEGFSGVVLLNRTRGVEVVENGDEMILVGKGGENWDDVVKITTDKGYTGVEALSAIPGTLGAAPVQNIGAYGQEVADTLISVRVFDSVTKEFREILKEDCGFSYRRSIFNSGKEAGRYFITEVKLGLKKGEMASPFYNSLQRFLDEKGISDYSPKNIREAVIAVRAGKLPDPEKIASAGSFFKNVYLDEEQAKLAEMKEIPVRRKNGENKVNTGWLIEKCGLLGAELFGFRVSEKAALVLINERATSFADLEKAKAKIVGAVKRKFGYEIEQEPVILGDK